MSVTIKRVERITVIYPREQYFEIMKQYTLADGWQPKEFGYDPSRHIVPEGHDRVVFERDMQAVKP